MIKPGSTIGILGGGQLGRMSILAGRHLGYRFGVYEPVNGSTGGRVADWEINCSYEDEEALRDFASRVDVVTLEFENVPEGTLEYLEQFVKVSPGVGVLRNCRNRVREKEFLKKGGYPTAKFEVIREEEDLEKVREWGVGVLKIAEMGYDGKGQVRVASGQEVGAAWKELGGVECVLEDWVTFECECSVIVGRNEEGEMAVFPVGENVHKHQILYETRVPAGVEEEVANHAKELGKRLAEELGVVGLLAVELFVMEGGGVLVNEMAPRPHNSGHYTMDGCETSQFEQHIRAVCGLPLGGVGLLRGVKMRNLLGDLWEGGEPDWDKYLRDPSAHLYLYDKGDARRGRKMGHVNFLD